MWVVPGEVEAVSLRHPEVADAGVVVPRDRKPSIRLVEELTALVAARLPAYQRPRRIVVVEDLPWTPTGKLQRFALRARAERVA